MSELQTVAIPQRRMTLPSEVFDDIATIEHDIRAFNGWAATLGPDELAVLSRLMFGPPSKVVRHDDGTTDYHWGR